MSPQDNDVEMKMEITIEKQRIDSYGGGAFVINAIEYPHTVLVLPEQTVRWEAKEIASLTLDGFSFVLNASPRPELLLIGTGKQQLRINPAVSNQLRKEGVVVECMDTGAACQTFNVLMAEERRVAAALLPV